MTELKTLKDLLKKNMPPYLVYNEVKQEAIKWVKLMDRNKTHWVKHFFNITEEDLK